MIIFVVWYYRDLFVFIIFLYLNICGKNCFLKKLVGQNVKQTFVFVGQFLRWVGQCPMSDHYFKHCCLSPLHVKDLYVNVCKSFVLINLLCVSVYCSFKPGLLKSARHFKAQGIYSLWYL